MFSFVCFLKRHLAAKNFFDLDNILTKSKTVNTYPSNVCVQSHCILHTFKTTFTKINDV